MDELLTLIMHDSTTDEAAYYALPKPGCQSKPQMLDLTVIPRYILIEIRLRLIKALELGCD